MSALIGALRVTLGLDSAAFEKGATSAGARIKGLHGQLSKSAGLIGGAFAAIGLSGIVGQALDMASALSEDAEKLGLTVEGLQELRFAAQQSGVEQETLATNINKLNRSLGDLQAGKKSAVNAFAAIGLSAADLKGKDAAGALRIIADALNKLPDPQARVAAGAAIMGKNFAQLLPLLNGGSKALDDYAQSAKAAGEISTEQAKQLDQLRDRWDAFKRTLLVAVAQSVAGYVQLADEAKVGLQNVKDFFNGIDGFFERLADKAGAALSRMAAAFKTWVRDSIGSTIQWFEDKLKSLGDSFDAIGRRIGQGAQHLKASFMTLAGEGGLQLAAFGDQAEAVSVQVQKTFKDMADATLGALDRLAGSIKGGGFLDILSAVIGLGLQLGSVGLFGKGVAARINGTGATTSTPRLSVPSQSGFSVASLSKAANNNGATLQIVDTTGLFAMKVQGQINGSTPAIVRTAVSGSLAAVQRASDRRLA